ncbi:MAG: hypothetical protein QXZ22_05765 [Sulfolobales archaeon]
MSIVELVPYLVFIPLSALATYATRRDVVPITAAVLTAFYASIGNASLSVVSALTVVFYSLIKISLAKPTRARKVVLMKLKYVLVVFTVLASSILVAYIALGSAISMSPTESRVLAVVIVVLLYSLMSTAVVPKLLALVNFKLWQAVRIDSVEDLFWKLGVFLGGIAMFANTVFHGVLGLVLMLIYVTAFFATQRRRFPILRITVSIVAATGAVITYLTGYT